MSNLISKILISEPESKISQCIIALPGRGVKAELMEHFCEAMELPETLIVSPETRYNAWYAQPKSPEDQEAAVKTLPNAINEVKQVIQKVKNGWKIKDEQIIILGYSAGAVVAIQVAAKNKTNFKCCVSLAGAILEPHTLPANKKKTPFILQHNYYDDCFEWNERYIPMREALLNKGYSIKEISGEGNHNSFTTTTLLRTKKEILSIT